jgi:hypothetical protein
MPSSEGKSHPKTAAIACTLIAGDLLFYTRGHTVCLKIYTYVCNIVEDIVFI